MPGSQQINSCNTGSRLPVPVASPCQKSSEQTALCITSSTTPAIDLFTDPFFAGGTVVDFHSQISNPFA